MNEENVLHMHYGILFDVKKSEEMNFAGKWLKLEKILFLKITHTQKHKYGLFLLLGYLLRVPVFRFKDRSWIIFRKQKC